MHLDRQGTKYCPLQVAHHGPQWPLPVQCNMSASVIRWERAPRKNPKPLNSKTKSLKLNSPPLVDRIWDILGISL